MKKYLYVVEYRLANSSKWKQTSDWKVQTSKKSAQKVERDLYDRFKTIVESRIIRYVID